MSDSNTTYFFMFVTPFSNYKNYTRKSMLFECALSSFHLLIVDCILAHGQSSVFTFSRLRHRPTRTQMTKTRTPTHFHNTGTRKINVVDCTSFHTHTRRLYHSDDFVNIRTFSYHVIFRYDANYNGFEVVQCDSVLTGDCILEVHHSK